MTRATLRQFGKLISWNWKIMEALLHSECRKSVNWRHESSFSCLKLQSQSSKSYKIFWCFGQGSHFSIHLLAIPGSRNSRKKCQLLLFLLDHIYTYLMGKYVTRIVRNGSVNIFIKNLFYFVYSYYAFNNNVSKTHMLKGISSDSQMVIFRHTHRLAGGVIRPPHRRVFIPPRRPLGFCCFIGDFIASLIL